MKKNLSLILSTLLVATISLTMLGCNKSTSKEEDTTENSNEIKADLTISAAASLKESMADIEIEFKKEYPNINLTFNYGSSGSLQQQIEQGAPSDVFISAGKSQMTALNDKNLMLSDSWKDLVTNKLVLVGPKDSSITSINDLTSDSVNKIAVGEPSSVPAGKYADETLKNLGIYDSISSKLVFAKDVKEVLTWSTTGNADVGFVYLSDAISNDSAKIIENISEDLHSPITYPIGIVKATKNEEAAKDFVDFLFTDTSNTIFEKYGYTPCK